MSGHALTRSWRDVAAGGTVVSQESAAGDTRKGRPDSLSEAQSRPTPGTRPEVGENARMFDQLTPSQEQKVRRFPALERRNTNEPPQKPRSTQRYDAVAPCGRTCSSPEEPRRQGEPPVAPPHEATGFGRASSNPEEPVWRRHDKPPVLFSRLPTAPASFPSLQEEVKVMQQTSREAWTQLGVRFYTAHSQPPCLRLPPSAHAIAPSVWREEDGGRRGGVRRAARRASHPPPATANKRAARAAGGLAPTNPRGKTKPDLRIALPEIRIRICGQRNGTNSRREQPRRRMIWCNPGSGWSLHSPIR